MVHLHGLAFALCLLLTAACTHTEFINVRDVPAHPTFTVLPANNYIAEVEFARRIEAALVGAGVSVLSPPPAVEVTNELSIQAGEAARIPGSADGRSSEAKQTTRFWSYDELTSTYVVNTIRYAKNHGQVRIEVRATREVVSVFQVYDNSLETRSRIIKKAIAALRKPADSAGGAAF